MKGGETEGRDMISSYNNKTLLFKIIFVVGVAPKSSIIRHYCIIGQVTIIWLVYPMFYLLSIYSHFLCFFSFILLSCLYLDFITYIITTPFEPLFASAHYCHVALSLLSLLLLLSLLSLILSLPPLNMILEIISQFHKPFNGA